MVQILFFHQLLQLVAVVAQVFIQTPLKTELQAVQAAGLVQLPLALQVAQEQQGKAMRVVILELMPHLIAAVAVAAQVLLELLAVMLQVTVVLELHLQLQVRLQLTRVAVAAVLIQALRGLVAQEGEAQAVTLTVLQLVVRVQRQLLTQVVAVAALVARIHKAATAALAL
jgi:hypothetical protein